MRKNRERKRHREIEKDKQRKTNRERQTEKDKQRKRDRERQTEKEREREREREGFHLASGITNKCCHKKILSGLVGVGK